eukprot:13943095-Alexandrium_andersonii.AAC.1
MRVVAVSSREARAARAVACRPFDERWARETLQGLVAAPWAWRREPAPADVAPQVIPRVAQEAVPPPPRPRAEHAPRRANATQSMLEEHGCAAGCLERSRIRERRPAAGTRHSEQRRA